MKRAPRSRQRHDLYAKYHDYDSEISDLLGECGLRWIGVFGQRRSEMGFFFAGNTPAGGSRSFPKGRSPVDFPP